MQSTEDLVKAQLFKVVIDGAPTNIGGGIFSAIAIAIVFPLIEGDGSSITSCWWWCALMIALMLQGVWLGKQASKVADTGRLLRHQVIVVAQAGCIAAAWGVSSWMLLPTASPAAEALLITAMALVVMGGAGNQAPHREMLLTCTLTLAIVFSTGLARFGDRFHISMAVLFVLYALITLWVAKNQGIAVRQQILLNLENQSLRAIAEAERERAAAASEAKTTFLAATSHDLRQPLHALVQYYAHLDRANRDPQLHDTVRRIGASLDAMRDLLDSILDLSRLMVGGVQPFIAAFPAAAMLERLEAQLRPLAMARGLQLAFERSSALILSDEVLLERILRNLILNSIRYTNYGQITVRCRPRREVLQIQVWDTGIGIPAGELRQIFDPFYQLDNRARDRRKGLGLGLAIVRQLCDLLGYRIQVRTKVGQGTVFVVRVPLCSDSSRLREPPRNNDTSVRDYVRGAFVVLLDDDPLSRDASECTLRRFGCRTLAAACSIEAIGKLQHEEFAPQILMADALLAAETGVEAIHGVTENLRGRFGEGLSMPALVVSCGMAPGERGHVSDHDYPTLQKPVSAEDLWKALNQLLESKARGRER